ncbi:transporter substrate-binding domain-containing protein [Ruegeria sp. HKCCD8929]|uniref:transporter substrate-binding domain-containing protein n=1 Tax=Ruegeria sp. HKCCD8929 TaxID=2683006 RepID=UPI0014885E91|nr:transporter substrate-binding domain-containing protein [Ruegeria sp. HKCCD8929]
MSTIIENIRKYGLLVVTILAATAVAASAESTLEKIKQTGQVTVGTEAAFPPFEFVEDGKIVGYGKDILDVVIADLDVELNQLDLPWQGILPGVLAGKFDFVATSVTINPERAKQYAFTVPIAEGTTWIMKRKGDTSVMSVEDMAGKVVGTQLASGNETASRAFEEDMIEKGLGGYGELKLFTSYPEVTLALANGTLDVAVQNLPNLAVIIKNQPDMFELVGPITDKSYFGWVTRPEDTDLRDYLSEQILKMRDSGEIEELQDKWFGFQMEIPSEGYLPEGAL